MNSQDVVLGNTSASLQATMAEAHRIVGLVDEWEPQHETKYLGQPDSEAINLVPSIRI